MQNLQDNEAEKQADINSVDNRDSPEEIRPGHLSVKEELGDIQNTQIKGIDFVDQPKEIISDAKLENAEIHQK